MFCKRVNGKCRLILVNELSGRYLYRHQKHIGVGSFDHASTISVNTYQMAITNPLPLCLTVQYGLHGFFINL